LWLGFQDCCIWIGLGLAADDGIAPGLLRTVMAFMMMLLSGFVGS